MVEIRERQTTILKGGSKEELKMKKRQQTSKGSFWIYHLKESISIPNVVTFMQWTVARMVGACMHGLFTFSSNKNKSNNLCTKALIKWIKIKLNRIGVWKKEKVMKMLLETETNTPFNRPVSEMKIDKDKDTFSYFILIQYFLVNLKFIRKSAS